MSWNTSPIAWMADHADHQGNPEQSVTIQLQWATMPEWLPSVTVNQQVNHITHVNGSCRGDPATDPVSLPLITRENHQ
jgi:hypothetical protein